MRILVCGGRDYSNRRKVEETLCDIYFSMDHEEQNVFVLIHGKARGADRLASDWCKKYASMSEVAFPADWDRYGKRAGYIRNQQMLDEGKPDLVIAFPGGKGTKMMVELARKANVEVLEVG